MKSKVNKFKIVSILTILPIVSYAGIFDPRPTDLSIPSDIYNRAPADILNVQLRTVINNGDCKVKSNGKKDFSGCTLDDVNNDTNLDSDKKFKPQIKVHFVSDDFSDDGSESNATLRQRGGYSRFAAQKSYRIKLNSKDDLWRDQRKLQLNKHPWDLLRIRNKLSFDLMKDIPNLPSLNTQFVNLSIDNVNYGIFTHVENIGKEFLINRGWHKESRLYKARDFSFRMGSEFDVDSDGRPVDKEAFEQKVDIKNGKRHAKFTQMLAAVNNPDKDFQTEVFGKYFNQNNYLSWMAVNILTGNLDVSHANFYLYNPKGSKTFYFIPWDYDDTWGIDEQPDNVADGTVWEKHQFNPQHLWTSKLHQRFLKQPGSIELLKEAVSYIKDNYFTKEKIKPLLKRYQKTVSLRIKDSNGPDFYNLPTTATENDPDSAIVKEYDHVFSQMLGRANQNYRRFIKELESPMPFHISKPTFEDGKIHMTWSPAFDLQGDPVHYHLKISTTPDFTNGKVLSARPTENAYSTDWDEPTGDYYLRIVAYDDQRPRNWQNSSEDYILSEGTDAEVVYHNSYHFSAP